MFYMKLTHIVVQSNFTILGFEVEGKESEFGGIGDRVVTTSVTLEEMKAKKFRNNQIDCRGGKIKEVGSFRLKDLDMKMFNGSKMTDIDNSITLTRRLLVGGELAGFEVQICGETRKFKTKDLISLSNWFNGANYMVKTKTSSKGEVTKYIAGKAGNSLSNLPEVELSSSEKTKDKKKKIRTATDGKKVEMAPKLSSEYDILQLFDEVGSLDGLIIEFPNKKYKNAKVQELVASPKFIKLGIGNVGNPKVRPSRDKMNINCLFRVPGQVQVTFNGQKISMTTFVNRSHHIYKDGELYDGDLGLIVKKDKVDELKQTFAASLGLEQVTDQSVVNPIRSIYGDESLVAFKIDARNLSLMSRERAKKFMMTPDKLHKVLQKLIELDTQYKYFNGKAKEAKLAMAQNGEEPNRPLYGPYAGMNKDMIDACVEAGIDVYTGAFIETVENEKAGYEQLQRNMAELKGDVPKSKDYSVKYSIKGYATIPSLKDIEGNTKKAEKYLSEELIKEIDKVSKMGSVSEIYEYCNKKAEAINQNKDKAVKLLFYHNIASITIGEGKYALRSKYWDSTTKEGVYVCSSVGYDDVQVAIKGGLEVKDI